MTGTTAVTIPDYVTVKRSHTIRDLAGTVADLLDEANGLESPESVDLYRDKIELMFSRDPRTFQALAQWAERFGGTVTGEPNEDTNGRPVVRCDVRFIYHAVDIHAYAYVRASADT